MNRTIDSTEPQSATRIIPIPYANQNPSDDLCVVLNFFGVLERELERASGEDRGMSKVVAAQMLHVAGHVSSLLTTLQRFLDDDSVPSFLPEYQAVRMAEVLEKWELAQ